MSSPRATALVDLGAITSNVRRLGEIAGVPVMAVVKADAYGHGLIPSARAAIDGGAAWLGVALVDEALALRAGGIDQVPVLAWLTPPDDRFVEAIEAGIDLSVASVGGVEEIAAAARACGRTARVHLEVDTGMTRGGALAELDAVISALLVAISQGSIDCVGIWSHFASADQPDSPQNVEQRHRFDDAIARAAQQGLRPKIRHLANSAATLMDPLSRYDMVRCGIACYGLSPDFQALGPADQWGLTPAMQLQARLALVKAVPAGAHVSYGATFTFASPSVIGIIPVGYADGIPRHGAGHLQVASAEGLRPVRGRICMDQIIMDCGPGSALVAGDLVTLFGGPGPSADEWGEWAGTIGYEIVTRLGPRVERKYTKSSPSDADSR